MIWKTPRIWEDGECWILGGGPSLPIQFDVPEEIIQDVRSKKLPLSAYSPYMSAIHDKHVIGVNMAFKIGDWIDMVFFGDKRWFFNNRKDLAKFPGLKVTCHPHFRNANHRLEHIKFLARDGNHSKGISSHPSRVSWNLNSGAAAISVAVNMGANRIILVGFDMKLGEDGKQHWHAEYGTAKRTNPENKKLPFHRHLLGFPAIAKDARRRNIKIINACPDSAIECFQKIPVKELLSG